MLWSPSLATTRRRATVLPEEHTLVEQVGSDAGLEVRAAGGYLLDPDPAVTRAGLVAELAAALGEEGIAAWKIDERIAFLSSDAPMVTPFGRLLRVEASMAWNLARLRDALRALDVGTVDIRKRGSPVDVEDIQRRLKPTGSRAATVVLTWSEGRPWAFVCSPPGPDAGPIDLTTVSA